MTERPGQDGLHADPGERYERVSRIATGGMGEVWRARDTVLGRAVAVKVLKQEYADDATFRDRFAAEARHAAGLHHPNIASVFDYGVPTDGSAPYLVMELVEGKPLSELLAPGRAFDPEQARALVAQTADALAVAHAAGVVHRDVKPANLMVTPDGRVKITDFGIARAIDSAAITQTGQIIGTPHYFSPEQAEGRPATAASDVYSLGVVLFECLTGRRPFNGDSPIATALAHLRQDVPELPDTVPADLAAITRRCLAKDPAERYADGGQLAAALRSPVDAPDATRVLGATAAAPLAAAAAPAAATQVVSRETRTGGAAPSTTGRSRWPWYAAALVALLLLVILLAARPWDDKTPSSTTASEKPSPSQSPSRTPSSSPSTEQVRVDKSQYVGRPVEDVRSDLDRLGLRSTTEDRPNDGTQEAGTVADLSPTGQVDKGARITLLVWTEASPSTTPSPSVPGKGKSDKGPGKGKKGG